ncbi:MAG: hypothetical protein ACO3A2_09020 [Bdellovibrionia bacterium]
MQWSCPHCGVTLAVPYDTLNAGWSFSRCYKCGGFALIRRAEVNIIKVDKAPQGEKVILPEAGTDFSAGMLSEEASQKLARHNPNKLKADKPIVRPARQAHETRTPAPLNSASPNPIQKFDRLNEQDAQAEALLENSTLPELPEKDRKPWVLGLSLTAVATVSSGLYLALQGTSLYQKVKDNSAEVSANKRTALSMNTNLKTAPREDTPALLPRQRLEEASHEPSLVTEERLAFHSKLNSALITDQLQESAMAPIKPPAMKNALAPAAHLLQVQPRAKRVILHEGPGLNYPVKGMANPNLQYVVADWKDRWFRIALQQNGVMSDVGWIRNDLVQVIPNSTSEGPTDPNINPLSN